MLSDPHRSRPSPDSLIAALAKARIPAENHDFITRSITEIGVVRLLAVERDDRPYVVASRRDGGRDLHIYYGYTTGFTSTDEITRLFGAGAGSNVNSPKGVWWVKHPRNQVGDRGSRPRDVRRKGLACDCGMQLSVTGVCSSCD